MSAKSNKVKTLFVGDVHGEFMYLDYVIGQEQPQAVVVAGDFGYWPRLTTASYDFEVPVYFVDGNHEDHNQLDGLVEQYGKENPIEVGKNCYYIPRGCIWTIGQSTLCGLGGAFSIDWQWRIPGRTWFIQEELIIDDLIDFNWSKTVDIVVSHTCPLVALPKTANTCKIPLKRIHNRKSETVLQQWLNQIETKPKKWFYGHWHNSCKFTRNGVQFELLDMIQNMKQYKTVRL